MQGRIDNPRSCVWGAPRAYEAVAPDCGPSNSNDRQISRNAGAEDYFATDAGEGTSVTGAYDPEWPKVIKQPTLLRGVGSARLRGVARNCGLNNAIDLQIRRNAGSEDCFTAGAGEGTNGTGAYDPEWPYVNGVSATSAPRHTPRHARLRGAAPRISLHGIGICILAMLTPVTRDSLHARRLPGFRRSRHGWRLVPAPRPRRGALPQAIRLAGGVRAPPHDELRVSCDARYDSRSAWHTRSCVWLHALLCQTCFVTSRSAPCRAASTTHAPACGGLREPTRPWPPTAASAT